MALRRPRPDAALSMGSGKADELKALIAERRSASSIFDNPLTPVQQRNLNRLWGVPVLDRTELILDIFAQRARSNEGKLQVELARIEHQLTRLVRGWTHLERQRGGIGQRGGPGEKQIELDRRMLDGKARQLRPRLDRLERQRQHASTRAGAHDAFTVSLVGYTNAGKSTLFNALTGAGTYAADQLFATLDTLTRRLRLTDGRDRWSCPTRSASCATCRTSWSQAFRATLEETAQADLLLHVVDASAPDRDGADRAGRARAGRDRCRRTCPRSWSSTRSTRPACRREVGGALWYHRSVLGERSHRRRPGSLNAGAERADVLQSQPRPDVRSRRARPGWPLGITRVDSIDCLRYRRRQARLN